MKTKYIYFLNFLLYQNITYVEVLKRSIIIKETEKELPPSDFLGLADSGESTNVSIFWKFILYALTSGL